ncbi:ATP-binding protein [Mastigocoleus sp. MO_188.B34]|uniref:ATP-binding protein n=1 Tax=Mastigocoleus sp. MO_188.B34 TaxID=3036635 RepID=UPI0026375022|nr:ATP-binding protein [Mastigocoleus sp. MO_188.B34]MDJ0694621.1 ATP-binding protein [Mastigocoleus sp. MO_188.B34]
MQQESVTAKNVNLTNCDREQIHIPNSIQPHGILFVLAPEDLTILQVSKNIRSVLGYNPEDILNQPLANFLAASEISSIQKCLTEDFDHVNPLKISFSTQEQIQYFDGIIHSYDGLVILELEPTQETEYVNFIKFYNLVNSCVAKLQNTISLLDTCNVIVNEVRKLTGFERVMVYRFNDDGSGNVIAESKTDKIIPYLGLRYPATDIPLPARKLYVNNWLRIISNVNYEPIEITPTLNPLTHKVVDLSFSSLRSVSPIHLEYLKNMGVTASMSISIIRNKQLWGLIACHDSRPQHVSYEVRTACEFLGKILSAELLEKQDNEELDYKIRIQNIPKYFIESIAQNNNFIDALVQEEEKLLDIVSAAGVVICDNDDLISIGKVPEKSEIKNILNWLEYQTEDNIYYTNSLPTLYPQAKQYKKIASGLLALTISKIRRNYILWFRPEVIQTVNWGGNPVKQVENLPDGEVRIHPRKSFELWQETVKNSALPWKKCEIEVVAELRSAIISIVLSKADELARVNLELERSNDELDSFAYIASHDLKEPLRGIHNYSSFLMEDYAEVLDEEGISKLQTLIRLTQRMEDLIDSLLHFSRLGRVDLSLENNDLNEILDGAIDVIKMSNAEDSIEISVPRKLPKVNCDRIQINELLTNLISNAIKYNKNDRKQVEIGFLDTPEELDPNLQQKIQLQNQVVLYVKDNGIGIPQKHHENVFRIFKRLYGKKQYGGGTGAGLTIAKKIVERHGGEIWLKSEVGVGTTFYLSLPV